MVFEFKITLRPGMLIATGEIIYEIVSINPTSNCDDKQHFRKVFVTLLRNYTPLTGYMLLIMHDDINHSSLRSIIKSMARGIQHFMSMKCIPRGKVDRTVFGEQHFSVIINLSSDHG